MKELSIEQKARAYDEAKSIMEKYLKSGNAGVIAENTIKKAFPELTESEDERIRKWLIGYFQRNKIIENIKTRDIIAWLEKQGKQEQLYIRFGEIPTNEKSKIYRGEIEVGTENGVSVYPAFITDGGNIVLGLTLPITKTTLHTQQHLIEYDDRPCYLVKGNYVGKDTDGQPLINNVSIIKKIDSYRVKEEKQDEQKPLMEGTFVNVDEVREDFMQEVYRVLDADPTNDRANQIIDAFDHLPTITIQKPAESRQQTRPNGWIVCEDFNEGDGYYKVNLAYLSKSQVELIENLVASWQTPANNAAEWSDVEESEVATLEAYIRLRDWSDRHIYRALGIVDELVNKVKSIRYQKQWKPTEEQMKALHDLNLTGNISYAGQGQVLIDLYNSLKELT